MTVSGKAALFFCLALAGCAASDGAVPAAKGPLRFVFREGQPVTPSTAYAGAVTCRGCHEGVYRFWAGTAHADSLASLERKGAEKEAACLRCHTTGYGEKSGFAGRMETPGLSSVSCESCHGAASGHSGSERPGDSPTALGSDCPPCEINRACRACHTPAWSPDFQLKSMLDRVSCRKTPEDASGPIVPGQPGAGGS